jgi:hypothetical protein
MKPLPRRSKRNELTPGARLFLLHGLALDFDKGDVGAERALWKEHRVELLAEWIRESPGTRPEAWWEFEKPSGQLRRQIGGPAPLDDSPIWRGIPSYWPCTNLLFEPEVEFLKRLGLLTREERNAYPTLKAAQRAELKIEALRESQPPRVGILHLPHVSYTSEQIDVFFAGIDEVDDEK